MEDHSIRLGAMTFALSGDQLNLERAFSEVLSSTANLRHQGCALANLAVVSAANDKPERACGALGRSVQLAVQGHYTMGLQRATASTQAGKNYLLCVILMISFITCPSHEGLPRGVRTTGFIRSLCAGAYRLTRLWGPALLTGGFREGTSSALSNVPSSACAIAPLFRGTLKADTRHHTSS